MLKLSNVPNPPSRTEIPRGELRATTTERLREHLVDLLSADRTSGAEIVRSVATKCIVHVRSDTAGSDPSPAALTCDDGNPMLEVGFLQQMPARRLEERPRT